MGDTQEVFGASPTPERPTRSPTNVGKIAGEVISFATRAVESADEAPYEIRTFADGLPRHALAPEEGPLLSDYRAEIFISTVNRPDVTLLPSTSAIVTSRLAGRVPLFFVYPDGIHLTFRVANNRPATKLMVEDFALRMAAFLGFPEDALTGLEIRSLEQIRSKISDSARAELGL
jgi:hypothetical protein